MKKRKRKKKTGEKNKIFINNTVHNSFQNSFIWESENKKKNNLKDNMNKKEKKIKKEKNYFLKIEVKPTSKHDKIFIDNDRCFIEITSPPIKGKANKAIISFLAEILKIPKSNISIIQGQTASTKTLLIENCTKTIKEIISILSGE